MLITTTNPGAGKSMTEGETIKMVRMKNLFWKPLLRGFLFAIMLLKAHCSMLQNPLNLSYQELLFYALIKDICEIN